YHAEECSVRLSSLCSVHQKHDLQETEKKGYDHADAYSEVPDWIFRLLPFFSIWLILPRMRQSTDGRLVPLFIIGAG
ncbi:hypothetical protein AB9F45_40075, partial [Rhizobium leguminosarum]